MITSCEPFDVEIRLSGRVLVVSDGDGSLKVMLYYEYNRGESRIGLVYAD
jgi:hypothetical protein